ncbi:MAG: hypothetical protein JWO67_6955 [Streptosporangiaceae bacterium]|nr:hypothetical protein [Streptosporangiaceae bacterium]
MSRFDYSYAGVGEFMRTDPDLAAGVRRRAEVALAFAQSIAPVGTPEEGDHHPGHYRDSLQVHGPVAFSDRAGHQLGSDAGYAADVEHAHQVLARTVATFSDPHGGSGL